MVAGSETTWSDRIIDRFSKATFGSVSECCSNVFFIQLRQFVYNVFDGMSRRKKSDDVSDGDSHSTNARLAAHNERV